MGLKVCVQTCEVGLKSLHANLRDEVEGLDANLRGEVQSLRANLRGGVESLRENLRGEVESLHGEAGLKVCVQTFGCLIIISPLFFF